MGLGTNHKAEVHSAFVWGIYFEVIFTYTVEHAPIVRWKYSQ